MGRFERIAVMPAAFALLATTLAMSVASFAEEAGPAAPAAAPYGAWKHGPPADANYFPIAVWLQDPKNAAKYKAAGFNLYVGLWKGPTEEQLAALKAAGMPVICDQNEVGLRHKDDPTIVGWMHGDEPDNAQSLASGTGYGPPIPPEKIVADYERLRAADPTRPVMLNLGQGVAWDGWYGRGVRTNRPEDYPEYAKGGDIISFDIYPVAHPKPEIQGKLWYVPRGVERLVKWTGGRKIVWNCIECTRIQSDRKAAPAQVRAEVWMSLISGSRGLIYFVHEWNPKFNEHALLDDPEMLAEVAATNKQIHELAPVLNSPTARGGVAGFSVNGAGAARLPDDDKPRAMVRQHGGAIYVLAVGLSATAKVTLEAPGAADGAAVEVIGEGRTLKVAGGRFDDDFGAYAVHLYRIK